MEVWFACGGESEHRALVSFIAEAAFLDHHDSAGHSHAPRAMPDFWLYKHRSKKKEQKDRREKKREEERKKVRLRERCTATQKRLWPKASP
jgi:G:T-mismatch repair DNA endonuclease (very short patch repair protein)